MKRLIFLLLFIFAVCSFAFAQTPLAGFEKAREIKLLESTRNDVKRILVDYESDDSDYEDSEWRFSNENVEIEVSFSSGDCSDDDNEYWNVAKDVATKIEITFENDIKVEDFKFDFSNFTKEEMGEDYFNTLVYQKVKAGENPESYIYQNENSGIIFKISDEEIDEIILIPSKNRAASLCKNEKTEKILSKERRLIDSVLRDEVCILRNLPGYVEDLVLSADEIIDGCRDAAKDKACAGGSRKILIKTIATDPENDVLTYNYEVSAGTIVGQGAKVVWDLTGVPPGTYTITSWVDDGCGNCGTNKTQTVVVKECPDCAPK
jgi:hypothetical protein